MPRHLPSLLITIIQNSPIYFLGIPADYAYILCIIFGTTGLYFLMKKFNRVLISYYLGLCYPRWKLKLWNLNLSFSEIHGLALISKQRVQIGPLIPIVWLMFQAYKIIKSDSHKPCTWDFGWRCFLRLLPCTRNFSLNSGREHPATVPS